MKKQLIALGAFLVIAFGALPGSAFSLPWQHKADPCGCAAPIVNPCCPAPVRTPCCPQTVKPCCPAPIVTPCCPQTVKPSCSMPCGEAMPCPAAPIQNPCPAQPSTRNDCCD